MFHFPAPLHPCNYRQQPAKQSLRRAVANFSILCYRYRSVSSAAIIRYELVSCQEEYEMKKDVPPRDRVFQTASRLLYQNGYCAIGVDTIAAESGIGKMTLYRHYP